MPSPHISARLIVLRLPVLLLAALLASAPAFAGGVAPGDLEQRIEAVLPAVTAWRRDFHQYPELGTLEARTAAKVAAHLRGLGLEVREGLGITGVAGLLRGGRPGPRIALRADMDALPVTEATGLPFASSVRTTYRG